MASLKEVRNRIESVKSTEQITNAMKMVAASKLRRSQDSIIRLRPYSGKLNEIISHITETVDSQVENPYAAREEEPQRALIVAVSSNKGLCGTFNANIIKSVQALVTGEMSSLFNSGNLDIICIGKKVHDVLIKKRYPVIAEYNSLFSELTYENVLQIAETILEGYVERRWDRVIIVYNYFRNAAVQITTNENFLPLAREMADEQKAFQGVEYLFEPEREAILKDLIPQGLKIQFFKTILDSFAGEHGARMTAMHQATENASEMLKDLRLAYNKARQASITREIIEIVSGAEALKG